jgi:hypothetical protein
MFTAAQCQALAREYNNLSQAPNISQDRAFILKNIAPTFYGLGQPAR